MKIRGKIIRITRERPWIHLIVAWRFKRRRCRIPYKVAARTNTRIERRDYIEATGVRNDKQTITITAIQHLDKPYGNRIMKRLGL
jgi:hypothetical protein